MVVREFINKIGFAINESEFRTVEARVNSLKGRLQRFGTFATAFITAPFVGLNIWVAKTLSSFEQLDVAFETMLGSADKAKILVEDMLQFAAKTPFEIKEIGPTVKQLLAVGIESDKVLDTLKALGDVASGLSVPVSRLALNFGQIKTQGKLTGRELRDFAVAGVPLTKELSKMLGVSEKEISKMVSTGKIGFDDVDKAFKNMTSSGGRFANLMTKQAKTLGGMWSNFLDLITLTVRDYRKELLPMFKGIVGFMIKVLDFFKNGLSPVMKRAIFIVGGLVAAVGPLILAFTALVTVGMFVRKTLLAISVAARAANISTSLFMLKFALMGAVVISSILLAMGLFEDITIFLKGGDSLLGRMVKKLDILNSKSKEAGVFSLENFKNLLKSFDKLLQSNFDFWVGFITGKWKFAFDSMKNVFTDFANTISRLFKVMFSPLIDFFNLVTDSKINIGELSAGNAIESLAKAYVKAESSIGRVFSEIGRNIATPVPIGAGSSIGLLGQPSINSTVNLTLENNPTAEQIDTISGSLEEAVNKGISKAARSIANSFPGAE